MKLYYADQAIEALQEIYDFLSNENENAADTIHDIILDAIDNLLAFPEMASIETMLEGEPEMFRSLVIESTYKAIYFIEDDTINIVDVWDCRRDPKMLTKRIKKTKIT